jgi:beta-lactamase class A
MKPTRRQCLFALASGVAAAALRDLEAEWRRIAKSTDGTVGAAAMPLDSGRLVSLNGDERFHLQSVCKLPLAMHFLALIDEGKMTLDQPIEVLPRDIVRYASPLAKRWPGERRFPLGEMISSMVAQSDNTAVETLWRISGGEPALSARFRQWRVEGIRLDRSERQCGLDRYGVTNYPPPDQWTDELVQTLEEKVPPADRRRAMERSLTDPRDTGTPNGTVQLLARLFRGEALKPASTARLIDILKSTTTFPTRLKGLLPPGTVVAHKTGSSGTILSFTGATNDSGVVYLPKGRHLAISVYVKASTRPANQRDRVIAQISRAAYDAFL